VSTARTTRNGMHAFENPAGPDASRRDSVSPSVARPTSVVPAPSARTTAPDHRLRWPEAVAITLALLLSGAVAAGLFRPMLPWLG